MLSRDTTRTRTRSVPAVLTAVTVLAMLAAPDTSGAQTRPSYMHGQNVSPAYEGWERDDPMTALEIEVATECDEEQALAEPADV